MKITYVTWRERGRRNAENAEARSLGTLLGHYMSGYCGEYSKDKGS